MLTKAIKQPSPAARLSVPMNPHHPKAFWPLHHLCMNYTIDVMRIETLALKRTGRPKPSAEASSGTPSSRVLPRWCNVRSPAFVHVRMQLLYETSEELKDMEVPQYDPLKDDVF